MTPLIGAVSVVLVAAVSGLVTWRVAVRAKSGKIDTTEAATLWTEGTAMRQELRDEVATLKEQLNKAVLAVGELNLAIQQSRRETAEARAETAKAREETKELMAQLGKLHIDLRHHTAMVDSTETRRIDKLPEDDRTDNEKQFMADAPVRQSALDEEVSGP